MTLATGTRVGTYEVRSLLGQGGMGQVYLAHDTKLDRDVALKVLPEAFAVDAERIARFQREARTLASLNHPNIAAIYALEEADGIRALVMELVEGEDLSQRIVHGSIPLAEALPIARQIADALEAAHEQGIIHRDLKPANVKVRADGTVKVLDFGLAKAFAPEAGGAGADLANSPTMSMQATQAGLILGTAAYMSPEQARGKTVDKRADIWAFACVLYEMVTGRPPFIGDDVSETLAAVIKEEPRWDDVPTRVQRLLKKCLEKDLQRRLRDIGDAWELIEEVPAAQPARARLDGRLAWGVVAGATAMAVALGPIVVRQVRPRPVAAPEPVRFQIALPENVVVLETDPAFAVSPDGRAVVFMAVGSDNVSRLWIRALDSLEARPLAGTEGSSVTPPIWSPDSRFVAFDADGKLKRIDVSGGPAQSLCEAPARVGGGSWNREGVIIFGQATGGGLMRVSAAGGKPSPLTRLDPSRQEIGHLFPSFLPDGKHFLYLRYSDAEKSGAYVGSLDVKPEEQDMTRLLATAFQAAFVPSSGRSQGQVLFRREQTLMAQAFDERSLALSGEPVPVAAGLSSLAALGFFSASANGVLVYRTGSTVLDSQLTWFDREGKALARVGDPGGYISVALSPDGQRSAFSRLDFQSGTVNVWLLHFEPGTTTRFTFGPFLAGTPVWSPDGSRVVFRSSRDGPYNLYQKRANGGQDEELLLKSSDAKTPTAWSRDGRFLLYTVEDPQTKADLWVLPLGGDRKPVPFQRTAFNEDRGQFSPDSRWVASQSDESGRQEIYVREFPPNPRGGKWLVSKGGGTDPRWRANGRELFYVSIIDRTVMAVEVMTGPEFRSGPPKPLFKVSRAIGPATPFNVAPDGNRFLVSVPARSQTPLTVVLNWETALKK